MLLIAILCFIGIFLLQAMRSSILATSSAETPKLLDSLGGLFFYRPFHRLFFSKNERDSLLFALMCSQSLVRFAYAVAALFVVFSVEWLLAFFCLLIFATALFLVAEHLSRIIGSRFPEATMRASAVVVSLFLYITFPVTFLLIQLMKLSSKGTLISYIQEPPAKQELIEMIQEADLTTALEAHDRALLKSVLSFKEKIAREVMVPRVDLFCLPGETSIKEAARQILQEGYSRVPVYHETVDEITGILMYKDLLNQYMNYEARGNDPTILETPIESIQKNALYIPETKKISSLLQEFRKKQMHLAIVVDEYGGTEGIVTIEDILEEIVGEIADEYDREEELFNPQPGGAWIVDARMTIFDAEEELGIEIPQEGEYDTIGGYIFHTTGTIPSAGYVIHHENFEMEVLESNDRCVEKVRIKPIRGNQNAKV